MNKAKHDALLSALTTFMVYVNAATVWVILMSLALLFALSMGGCAHAPAPLPHRPMSEIDIQGHQEYGPRRPCPAVFDAPNGEIRQCL